MMYFLALPIYYEILPRHRYVMYILHASNEIKNKKYYENLRKLSPFDRAGICPC